MLISSFFKAVKKFICLLITIPLLSLKVDAQVLPSGFVDEYFSGIWNDLDSEPIVGITFDASSRLFAWTKEGKVFTYQASFGQWSTMLDIQSEVKSDLDGGMLGFVLDPNFSTNGYFYVYYSTSVGAASVGRVKRFKVVDPNVTDPITDYESSLNKILIGESDSTAIPITILSHIGGTLVFGTDGSLLVSTGDGAYYSNDDDGSHSNTDFQASLDENTMTDAENIGSNRAQLLSSHCGKLLRINPDTGDGLISNPFYDAMNPRSPQSRVWALGLRNPFRIMHIKNTGNQTDDPGDFLIGDVGQSDKEEFNIATEGGQNFGWPHNEGMDVTHERPLMYAPANPTKPIIDYREGPGRAQKNNMIYEIGSVDIPGVSPMEGNSAIAGVYYDNDTYPSSYQNTFFVGDASGEIFNVKLDNNYNVAYVNQFASGLPGGNVSMAIHPEEGIIYYVTFGNLSINRIIYYPFNSVPIAKITADTLSDTSPVVAAFTAINSYDLNSQTLTYQWDFGDDSPIDTTLTPHHIYSSNTQTTYKVKLTVTNADGVNAYDSVFVNVNNTPPIIANTSLNTLDIIAANQPYPFTLSASVTDDHTPSNELTYFWQIKLAHNEHEHLYTTYTGNNQNITLAALGCELGAATYWYRIYLTVTDSQGLSSQYFKDINLDCGGIQQSIVFEPISDKITTASPFDLTAISNSGLGVIFVRVSGPTLIASNTVTLTGHPGVVKIRAIQYGNDTYNQALTKEQSFVVNRPTNSQSISFDTIPPKNISDPTFLMQASSSSGLPVSYLLISGPATLSNGNQMTLTGQVGSVRVRAVQAGNFSTNGVYKERIFAVKDPCPNSLSLTQTITAGPPVVYQAGQAIEATNLIQSDATVNFRSGGSIELRPGFKVESGAVFSVQISPCN